MVLAVVGVILAGAIALGRSELSKLHARQVAGELRQVLSGAVTSAAESAATSTSAASWPAPPGVPTPGRGGLRLARGDGVSARTGA